MWRKTLGQGAIIVQFYDKRILGLEFKTNDCISLFLCIYLPYECDMFYDDFLFNLNKLQYIIESANTPYVFILDEYNADIQSESVFGFELINFCDTNISLIDLYFYLTCLYLLAKPMDNILVRSLYFNYFL